MNAYKTYSLALKEEQAAIEAKYKALGWGNGLPDGVEIVRPGWTRTEKYEIWMRVERKADRELEAVRK